MDKMLTTAIVLESEMGVALKNYFNDKHGFNFSTALATNDYRKHWRMTSNLITWGIKWRSEFYSCGSSKNVLFLENGLLSQKQGVYCDHLGYFCDSSLVKNKTNQEQCTSEQVDSVNKFLFDCFNLDRTKEVRDKNGPILVAMQMNGDAPMRHHFPLANKRADRKMAFLEALVEHLPKDREVIIRTHPKEPELPSEFLEELPPKWSVNSEGSIYKMLNKCSAIVTVNSTVATESLIIPDMPIATFGHGSFNKTGCMLDCSYHPELVAGILDFVPNKANADRYLCAIKKRQLPYRGSDFESIFDQHESIQIFIKSRKK